MASLFGFIVLAPNGESVPPLSPDLMYSAVWLCIASALIQVTINWAPCSVSPTRAPVSDARVPVSAGLGGRLGGERRPGRARRA
ncbi:EamA family transporter, partial [Erwinia amylovora]|nr:EamA family transporter [Erwinia amylovora]